MGRLQVNLTEAVSFDATEPGTYPMKVEKISDAKPSKSSAATVVEVTCVFLDPVVAKKCGSVIRTLPITGKGAGFFKAFWKNVVGEDLPDDDTIDVDTDDALGREFIADITNEPWEGEMRNKIAKWIPA